MDAIERLMGILQAALNGETDSLNISLVNGTLKISIREGDTQILIESFSSKGYQHSSLDNKIERMNDIRTLYLEGKSQREIGKAVGLSQSSISKYISLLKSKGDI